MLVDSWPVKMLTVLSYFSLSCQVTDESCLVVNSSCLVTHKACIVMKPFCSWLLISMYSLVHCD
jgi:hypothetical protein